MRVSRRPLRFLLAALAVLSIAAGVRDLSHGIALIQEVSGRVRPSIGIINIVLGLVLLGFCFARGLWRDPDA